MTSQSDNEDRFLLSHLSLPPLETLNSRYFFFDLLPLSCDGSGDAVVPVAGGLHFSFCYEVIQTRCHL